MPAACLSPHRVHHLIERRLARSTVQRDLANLSGIFRRARRKGWIATNPYDNAERVKVTDSGDFTVLSVEQL
jgi:site-specific recombinase XerD